MSEEMIPGSALADENLKYAVNKIKAGGGDPYNEPYVVGVGTPVEWRANTVHQRKGPLHDLFQVEGLLGY